MHTIIAEVKSEPIVIIPYSPAIQNINVTAAQYRKIFTNIGNELYSHRHLKVTQTGLLFSIQIYIFHFGYSGSAGHRFSNGNEKHGFIYDACWNKFFWKGKNQKTPVTAKNSLKTNCLT